MKNKANELENNELQQTKNDNEQSDEQNTEQLNETPISDTDSIKKTPKRHASQREKRENIPPQQDGEELISKNMLLTFLIVAAILLGMLVFNKIYEAVKYRANSEMDSSFVASIIYIDQSDTTTPTDVSSQAEVVSSIQMGDDAAFSAENFEKAKQSAPTGNTGLVAISGEIDNTVITSGNMFYINVKKIYSSTLTTPIAEGSSMWIMTDVGLPEYSSADGVYDFYLYADETGQLNVIKP